MTKKLTKEATKDLEQRCIRKFFLTEYKHIVRASKNNMHKLGIEASLEACEALFKDKSLIIKAFKEDDFVIFLNHGKNKFELIYDSKKRDVNGKK